MEMGRRVGRKRCSLGKELLDKMSGGSYEQYACLV